MPSLLLALALLVTALGIRSRVSTLPLILAAFFVGVARAPSAVDERLPRIDEELLAELCLLESSFEGGQQIVSALAVGLFASAPHSGEPRAIWMGRLPVSVWALWSSRGDALARSGDCWLFRGHLHAPDRVAGEHLFFTKGHGLLVRRASGDWYQLKIACVSRVRALRGRVRAALNRYAPSKVQPLFLALVLGDRSLLDDNQREAFVRTGTAHLLAISGLHVGLLAMWLFGLARLALSRLAVYAWRAQAAAGHVSDLSLCLALVGASIYVVVAGCSVSAKRSLLMFVAMLIAVLLRRPGAAGHALLLAALGICWWTPPSLSEPGLYLSVVSVASLLLLLRVTRGLALSLTRWWGRMLLLVASSAVAAAATAPLCLWLFGRVAIAGLWVNLLAIPMLGSMTLPPLLLGSSLSLLSPALGGLLIRLASWPAGLGLAVVEFAAEPSRSPEVIASLSGFQVTVIYCVAAGVVAFLQSGVSRR
jgi:ComEC/Rec2-related protein